MSTTIDERVVSMQFDNRNFEQNVSTSMSTLDKLKQKLNLTGASKGLAEVESAAKSCNLNPLCNAAEAVTVKFDAMAIMAKRALENIVDSAYSAGKRIVSALTIDPIKTGFSEYETQINSVQTILANTESKGSTLEDVNAALEELNRYADQTIYNFTEMTRNIGTFTAAGVDLDTSVNAIKGIANLAAVSGSTSQQASVAMYQLSQALASGTVKLMDWNSVVNAGMGGQVFQDALKETARVHGVAIDDMIEKQGSFRETLSEGWLTSEILTDTLQKFTLTTEGLTDEQIEANREMLRAKGYTEDQIEEIFKLGNTATNAATKVKTLTQMWDVMKESAQSGWAQTWKIIFGDFEEAKSLFTPLSTFFTNVIQKVSDWRNNLLSAALESPFGKIAEKLKSVGDVTSKVTESMTDLSEVVNRVIRGDFGNGAARVTALTEAGYEYAKVQNLVNEKLGCSFRYLESEAEAQNEVTESQEAATKQLEELTDAKLLELGLTKQEIEVYKKLQEISDRTGTPIEEINGRTLLIEALTNVGEALVNTFKAVKDAWNDIFEGIQPVQILNVVDAFHKFASGLSMTNENLTKLDENGRANAETYNNIKTTFKGLFALLDIFATLAGGGLKIAFEVLTGILGAFDMDILDLTARISESIISFHDWFESILNIEGVVQWLAPYFIDAANAVSEWIDGIKNSEGLNKFVDKITSITSAIGDWIEGMRNTENVSQYIAEGIGTAIGTVLNFIGGLISDLTTMVTSGFTEIPGFMTDGFLAGLWDGIVQVGQSMLEFGETILTTVCDVLGIHSPSTEMEAIGEYTIQGFIGGVENSLGGVWTKLQEFGSGVINFIKNLNLGKIFAIAGTIAILYFAFSISKAFSALAGVFDGLADISNNVSDFVKSFEKTTERLGKAVANSLNASAVKQLAISIAILAGAIAVLTLIGMQDGAIGAMWNAVAVIVALAAVMTIMMALINKFANSKLVTDAKTFVSNITSMAATVLALSASLILMALAGKILEGIDSTKLGQVYGGLAGMIVGLGLVLVAFGNLAKSGVTKNMDKTTKMIAKIGTTMLLLAIVAKICGGMTPDEFGMGAASLVYFGVLITYLTWATQLAGNKIKSTGEMIAKVGAAMLMMTAVMKICGNMTPEELKQGADAVTFFAMIVTGLVVVTRLAGGNKIDDIGKVMFGIATAMLAMAIVAKICGNMTPEELGKGYLALVGLSSIILILVHVLNLVEGKDLTKIGSTVMMMAVGIAVMAVAAALLAIIPVEKLWDAVGAVVTLAGMMVLMTLATEKAKDCKGNLTMMAVAIAVMAAAVAALSFVPVEDLNNALAALSVLMLIFTVLVAVAGKAQGSIGTLIVMTVAMGLMAAMFILLNKFTSGSLIDSAISLGIAMLALAAAVKVISSGGGAGLGKAAASILIMSAAMLVLAGALAVMNQLDPTKLFESLLILVGALAAIVVAMIAVTALAPGAAALVGVLLSVAAVVLSVAVAAVAFAGALYIVGLALPLIADGLTLLIESLAGCYESAGKFIAVAAALSVGLVLIGVGLVGLSVGVLAVAVSLAAGILVTAASITVGLLALSVALAAGILLISTSITVGLLAASVALTAGILLVASSLTVGLLAVSIALTAGILLVATGLSVGILAVAAVLTVGLLAVSVALTAGLLLVGAALTIGMLAVAGAITIASVAILILASSLTIGAAAVYLMASAVLFLGFAICEGLAAGIATGIELVSTAVSGLVDGIVGTICELLGIHSPSLVGQQIGQNFGDGVAIGIDDSKTGVQTSAAGLATAAETAAGNAGVEGGTSFMDSLGGSIDLSSIDLGSMDMESLTTMFDASGETGGTSFMSGLEDTVDLSSLDMGSMDMDSLTSMMNTSGEAGGTSFMTGLEGNVDLSTLDMGSMDVESLTSQFNLAGTESGTSFVEGISSGTSTASMSTPIESMLGEVSASEPAFTSAGSALVDALGRGIIANANAAGLACAKVASACATRTKNSYWDFYSAGGYLVAGFAAGITANTWRATARAAAMAWAAYQAAKNALDINSPSKLFRALGTSVPEGFAMGIDKMGGMVKSSAVAMADTAINGTKNAISRIADAINTDIDAQPTIRPVLDLSDIESGAGAIGSMFGITPSVGVLAHAGAINSMMNSRNQNVGYDDVVSAINKLGKDLGNVRGDSYNINGITYDDGSAVSDAVSALVRAIRIERRA